MPFENQKGVPPGIMPGLPLEPDNKTQGNVGLDELREGSATGKEIQPDKDKKEPQQPPST